MRGKIFYILLVISFFTSIFAQNKFEFDYARFYNPTDSSGYLELYYSFLKSELQLTDNNGEQLRQGKLSVKIQNTVTNEVVVDNSWYLDIEVKQNDDDLLVGVLYFPLEFSNYLMEIKAEDVNNDKYEVVNKINFQLPHFTGEELMVSDIELATGIVQQSQNTESIFFKNSLEVIPNPSLVYGDSNPVLFFYSEIYGIDKNSNSTYDISQQLFNSTNTVVYEKHRKVKSNNSSLAEIGAVKVNNLNSGIYTLDVSINDENNLFSAHSTKKVYIYNRDMIDESTNFAVDNSPKVDAQIMIMSEEELDYMAETSRYIATEFEKDQWDKLTNIEAKKNFLTAFWKKRDTNPSTPENEYREQYYQRLNYVNKNYGNLSTGAGWKTDRGRVYLTYGVPGEIERFQNETYTDPFEIWHYYDLEGGVYFIFADEEGLNIYRLIHSTKKGEIYNYNAYRKYIEANR